MQKGFLSNGLTFLPVILGGTRAEVADIILLGAGGIIGLLGGSGCAGSHCVRCCTDRGGASRWLLCPGEIDLTVSLVSLSRSNLLWCGSPPIDARAFSALPP